MPLDLLEELAAITQALADAGIDYALCGGLALGIHGFVRTTKDIDLLMQPADVPRALTVVKPLGFDIPARAMTFGLHGGTPRPVQRISKLDDATGALLSLDLLHVTPDLSEVWGQRVAYPWKDRTIHVVSRAGLVTMKKIAARPLDLIDIERLETLDDDEET